MNDDQRPPGIEAVDHLDVGPAPVGDLLHAGHTSQRRRRRTILGSVVAVTVLVVGGGFATAQVLGNDGDGLLVTDGTTTTPDQSLRVDVRMGVYPDQGLLGEAVWNPDERVVTYSTAGAYSSACPPEGSASTSGQGTVRLVLTTQRAVEEDCGVYVRFMIATISGFTEPPTVLVATVDGLERTVPVAGGEPSDPNSVTHGIKINTSHTPEGQNFYFEGALEEISLAREGSAGSVRSETIAGARTRTWDELAPGSYTIRAAVRPCSGNCGYLDPPTDSCEQTVTLDTFLTVDVTFTYGQPCTITVTSDDQAGGADTRTLDLPTSDWPASGVSREARITGALKVDDDDCVYLTNGGQDTPTSRVYAVWPAGFSATLDPDGNLTLVDPDGETVATDGDPLITGGGYEPNPGTEPCLPDFAAEVAYIEAEVDVERP